jgi:hypothetical protein
MRAAVLAVVIVAASALTAGAQDTTAPVWSGSATVLTYVIPDGGDYAQPTLALDRGALHVEARVNYEALSTASLWAGYNLEGGSTVTWTLTPMVGGAFGAVGGAAPGYTASVAWRRFDFYSEGELFFAFGTPDDSFLYNWSEIALTPLSWLRAGLVTQRTRVHATGREIQRGPFVGLTFGRLEVGAYMLDSPERPPTMALSFGWTFGAH